MQDRRQNIIEFLAKNVNDANSEFDTLERKAQQNISVGSILVAIVAAFKLNELTTQGSPKPLLFAIFFVYALNFGVSFFALFPRTWLRSPLEPSEKNVTAVEGKTEDNYY